MHPRRQDFRKSIPDLHLLHCSFQQERSNSAAAVFCCWILVLHTCIPEMSPKMAVCKRSPVWGLRIQLRSSRLKVPSQRSTVILADAAASLSGLRSIDRLQDASGCCCDAEVILIMIHGLGTGTEAEAALHVPRYTHHARLVGPGWWLLRIAAELSSQQPAATSY
jgi:hypothetical protein